MTPILTILPRQNGRRKPTPNEIEEFYQNLGKWWGARWFNHFAKRNAEPINTDAQLMHIRCTSHAYAICKE